MSDCPRFPRRLACTLLAAGMAALAACSTNPATGERTFTAFMSEQEEKRVGSEEHPKIVAQFGGEYPDAQVRAYVDRIGQRLARVSDMPDLEFTFTVLDDDIVNAFALPGGYVYISRGLLALANTEAELAGVLGHEIGHVTARHSAQRYSRSVLAGLGTAVVGGLGSVFLGTSAVGDVVGQGAVVYLQSFSREQEFEADVLGVRYLARAGYTTDAMAAFLASLEAYSALEAKVSGLPDPAERYNIMSTHPRTTDRVVQATGAANARPVPDPEIGNREYLAAIDGITFGDSEREGFARGQVFAHKPLDFRFEVPPEFHLINGAQQVLARGPNDSLIVFDLAGRPYDGAMTGYLTGVWAKGTSLREVEAITVNGMEAATGGTRVDTSKGPMDLRLVAIRRSPDRIFRFVFVTPPAQTARLGEALKRTTYSLRGLTPAERRDLKAWRIETVQVGTGDTVASLSRRMPLPGPKEEWFRVLNGLRPGSEPFPGQSVKVVVE